MIPNLEACVQENTKYSDMYMSSITHGIFIETQEMISLENDPFGQS